MNISNSYSYFLNQVSLAAGRRAHFFDAVLTTKTKHLALLLLDLNILRSFYRVDGSLYRFIPSYARSRRIPRFLKTYSRANGRPVLSLRALRVLALTTPTSHYVLETDKGLMTHREALHRRKGGLLLFVLS